MSNLNLNHCIFAGRLCADPEVKQTSAGKTVAQFRLAVNRPAAADGSSTADFISCVAWEKRGELVARYFKKGSAMLIIGRMQTRSWTDDGGSKRYATDVVADDVRFVDSRAEAGEGVGDAQNVNPPAQTTYNNPYAPPPASAAPAPPVTGVYEDVNLDGDLPF